MWGRQKQNEPMGDGGRKGFGHVSAGDRHRR